MEFFGKNTDVVFCYKNNCLHQLSVLEPGVYLTLRLPSITAVCLCCHLPRCSHSLGSKQCCGCSLAAMKEFMSQIEYRRFITVRGESAGQCLLQPTASSLCLSPVLHFPLDGGGERCSKADYPNLCICYVD